MKYCLIIGKDHNEGSVVTSPMGGCLIYDTRREAQDAAKLIAAGNLIKRYPEASVFVCKLAPVVFYIPFENPDPEGRPYVDETVVELEEPNDSQPN